MGTLLNPLDWPYYTQQQNIFKIPETSLHPGLCDVFWNDSSWTIIKNERVTPQSPSLWIKFFQCFANVSNVRVSESAKYKAKLVYQKASNSKYLEKNELFFVYWWLLILMIWNDTLRVKNKFYSGTSTAFRSMFITVLVEFCNPSTKNLTCSFSCL